MIMFALILWNQPSNPTAIKPQLLHVFIVVHKKKGLAAWRVEITTIENVASFGPSLPGGGVSYDDSERPSFLLEKLVNAEYSALKSPKFTQPLARVPERFLANIVDRGYKLAQEPGVRTARSRHSISSST
ncbi:unnamed protein product [Absidia cylindrospora]